MWREQTWSFRPMSPGEKEGLKSCDDFTVHSPWGVLHWIGLPWKSPSEVPHQVTVLADKAFKGASKLKWGPEDGLWSGLTSVLVRRGTWPHTLYRKMITWEHSEKAAVCKPRREASEGIKVMAPWSWISSFQNCEKINFFCLNHPVSGIWYMQVYGDMEANSRGEGDEEAGKRQTFKPPTPWSYQGMWSLLGRKRGQAKDLRNGYEHPW